MISDERGTRYLNTLARGVTPGERADFDDEIFVSWTGVMKSTLLWVEKNGPTEVDLLVDEFGLERHDNEPTQ
jgi:hypothetical protein